MKKFPKRTTLDAHGMIGHLRTGLRETDKLLRLSARPADLRRAVATIDALRIQAELWNTAHATTGEPVCVGVLAKVAAVISREQNRALAAANRAAKKPPRSANRSAKPCNPSPTELDMTDTVTILEGSEEILTSHGLPRDLIVAWIDFTTASLQVLSVRQRLAAAVNRLVSRRETADVVREMFRRDIPLAKAKKRAAA